MGKFGGSLVALASVLMLAGCGATGTFSDTIDDTTGMVVVNAENASKESAVASLGGGLSVETGQVVAFDSDFDKGSVVAVLLDMDGNVVFDEPLVGDDTDSIVLPAADYSFRVTCAEDGTTGTLRFVVLNPDIYSQYGDDLDEAVKKQQEVLTSDESDNRETATIQMDDSTALEEFEVPSDLKLSEGVLEEGSHGSTPLDARWHGSMNDKTIVLIKADSSYAAGAPEFLNIDSENKPYEHDWTHDVESIVVKCYGNEDGQAQKFVWKRNGLSYACLVSFDGDDDFGLAIEDVAKIVSAVK